MLLAMVNVPEGQARGARGRAARWSAVAVSVSSAVWGVARFATWIFYRVERVGHGCPTGPSSWSPITPTACSIRRSSWRPRGREPRFLAKSTLFSMPLVGWFVRGAGAIPVYRKTDAGVDPHATPRCSPPSNARSRDGDVVCLFPEGTTHSRGRLDPLKTGAARIALGAAARGIPVQIVAAGLNLDEKAILRSDATVAFGRRSLRAPRARLRHRPARGRRAVDGRDRPATSATS